MTKVINLFGGPGISKSTSAAFIFNILKNKNINSELMQEFAKELVWQERFNELRCQFHVTGQQVWRIESLIGKVDFIVSDSPILLGLAYCREEEPRLKEAMLEQFHRFDNINILLKRSKPYNPAGREQTYEQALAKDKEIKELLNTNNIPYITSDTDNKSLKKLTEETLLSSNIYNITENN